MYILAVPFLQDLPLTYRFAYAVENVTAATAAPLSTVLLTAPRLTPRLEDVRLPYLPPGTVATFIAYAQDVLGAEGATGPSTTASTVVVPPASAVSSSSLPSALNGTVAGGIAKLGLSTLAQDTDGMLSALQVMHPR
jgi:hypothetical protein